jgi:predicted N-acetyltransferase YhbS
MLRVEPGLRGRGVGAALLRAAELEARAQGARRIGLLAGDWQAPGFFAREGYAAGAAHDLGGGRSRRWLEKALT